nr:hypothetical protein [Tanacetum cinerariifolium]
MKSLSPHVVFAAKLPILNPNEFDLWKMRIEQYFLMTDYSLREVILNGDSPIATRVVDGVVQPVAPTTAEQRLAKKNELKDRETLLMALPDKHHLKFNIHKDAKSLMKAIEKRFGGNKETKKVQKTLLKQQYENFTCSSSKSLDQLRDRLQKLISQLEILGESLYPEDINLKFLRSLPTDVSAASTKVLISALPNVDNLSNVVIYSFFASQSNSPQLDNDDLKQIDADDLEEMYLKWQMAMLTMRAKRFLQWTGRNLGANGTTSIGFDMSKWTGRNLGANGTTSIGFDMSKVECYNYHKRGHFARECRSPKDTTQRRNFPVETFTSNALVSQCDGVGSYDWSFQADEEPTNYNLMAFTSSISSSFDNEVAPCSKACSKPYATFQSHYDKLTNDLRNLNLIDNALVELRKKFEKVEQDRDELKLKLEKFQTSSKNLSKLLESQITDETGLGYDNQVFNSTMFDYDELISSESDVCMPTSPIHDMYKSGEGYHAVPPPYTETFMLPKLDLVFYDALTANKTIHTILNVEPSPTKPNKDLSQPSVKPVEHPTPADNLRKDIPKSRQHRHSWNKKACFICKSLTHLIKNCDYYEKKMVQKPVSHHATRGNHQHYTRMTDTFPPSPAKQVAQNQ